MEFPDTSVLDEQKFYTCQQAYGLLLSINNLILTIDHIKTVITC